jgi:hypothetical protein
MLASDVPAVMMLCMFSIWHSRAINPRAAAGSISG